MEEVEGSNDDQNQQIVIRGKRTKRHRPASPFGVSVACSSSSGCAAAVGGGGGARGDDFGSNSSPTTSGGGGEVCESTEEEEDMANCLILLAQGGRGPGGKKVEKSSGRCRSSRKFTEVVASTAAGKFGFYVYECKTCNRTFPSFQALGGHRASHKKPKMAPPSEAKNPAGTASPVAIPILQSSTVTTEHEQDQFEDAVKIKGQSQFANHNSKSNKIHECSICGAEFTSGQALGGHMRRHRAATTTRPAAANTVTCADEEKQSKGRHILQLDLNLPAPEDDQRESSTSSSSKFEFASAKQSIVFSVPALIHCHY